VGGAVVTLVPTLGGSFDGPELGGAPLRTSKVAAALGSKVSSSSSAAASVTASQVSKVNVLWLLDPATCAS
jgi:hypothetical protein